uniref:Nef protein n=1 Tax=Human immunodeficiency virus type 1 TaxID=11676 RepID=H6CXE4_HV1|nr:nef protein [Human immunodeficiency virus 1]
MGGKWSKVVWLDGLL